MLSHACDSRRRTPMTADPLVIFTPSGKRGRVPAGTTGAAAARAARRRPRLGLRRPRHLLEVPGRARLRRLPQARPHRRRGRPLAAATPSRTATTASAASPPAAASAARRRSSPTPSSTCRPRARSTSRSSASAPRRRPVVMDPATRLHYVEVAEPDMHEPSGDLQRLERALAEQWGIENAKGDLRTLQMLQPALRKGDWKVTCAVHRDGPEARILQVWPGYYDGAIYGLAIDVGSTTIAGHLCDLATGAVLASTGLMNPQIRFGEDLMSRVSYAMLNPGGAAAMTRAVRDALNALVAQAAAEARIDPRADLRGGDRRQPGHAPPRARHRPDRARPGPVRARHRRRAAPLGRGDRAPPAPRRPHLHPALHRRPRRRRRRRRRPLREPAPLRRADARRRRRHQRRDPARQPQPRARLLLADRPRLRGRADLLRPARRARRHRARRDRPGDQGAPLPRHRRRRLVRRPGLPARHPRHRHLRLRHHRGGRRDAPRRPPRRLRPDRLGRADRQRPLRPPGPHPRLPAARRHPRHPGRRPRHPARASRRSTPARGC